MPEAETLLAKVLNRLLGPEEEGVLREQQIDGSKMPAFDALRRYLGPSGLYTKSESDGWFVTGLLLSKDSELVTAPDAPAKTDASQDADETEAAAKTASEPREVK
jgi:hypothetical protein